MKERIERNNYKEYIKIKYKLVMLICYIMLYSKKTKNQIRGDIVNLNFKKKKLRKRRKKYPYNSQKYLNLN